MEKKIKLYVLGEDRDLLDDVVKKINSNRPVDATLFSDLKDFLSATMASAPELFALSMDYPHPKISRFPKVFKMAMNLPVIIFGETNDAKSRKAVSLCNADFKINGKITAHNLWMKILNYQRDLENEEKDANGGKLKGGSNFIPTDKEELGNKFNPMASLLGQLGNDSSQSAEKSHQHIKSGTHASMDSGGMKNSESSSISSLGKNAVHVKSSKATKFQKNQASAVTNMIPKDAFLDDEDEFNDFQNSIYTSGNSPESNIHRGSSSLDDPDGLLGDNDQSMGFDQNHLSKNNSTGGSFNPNELNSLLNGGFMDSTDSSFDSDPKINNHITGKNTEDPGTAMGDVSQGDNVISINSGEQAGSMFEGSNMDLKSQEPANQDEIDKKIAELINQKDNDDAIEEAEDKEEGLNALDKALGEPLNEMGSVGDEESADPRAPEEKKEASEVGKPEAKESDKASQIPAPESKNDKETPLSKEEKEKEFKRKISILEKACDIALSETFGVEPLEESRVFDIQNLSVFSINQPSFKGYILFANSFNHKEDRNQIIDMESKISEYLDENGMTGGIGSSFDFEVPTVEYTQWAQETCDFTIQYEDETGKQYFLSFLPREKVLPPYSDADKNKEMIRVDLQHIPPNTPVDFDAFIHLPLNKRYVRYLKSERSISLDQAKRLLQDAEHKRLFVPKSEKQKFIQFYIKNAVYWEFMSYIKQNAS